jgi:hypothetical protein
VAEALAGRNDGAAKQAIVEFVSRTLADDVPAEELVAVFDNDGTLWCEKPLPIQADFILRMLFEMAEADPQLRDRQPWKAAYERDFGWLGVVLAEHYAGRRQQRRDAAGAYTSGAEQALERAGKGDWTVVSMKDDWATIF